MHLLSSTAAAALLLAACAAPGAAASASAAEVGVGSPAAAASAFLEAFNALNSARFDSFFAEDATMFFPDGPFPRERVEGKAAVTAAFRAFFEAARARGATRLNIRPQEMSVQDYGRFAVVSFHLRGGANLGRRSLVLRRDGRDWRIVHFHASALEARPN